MRLRDWQTHSWCLLAIYLALAMIVVVALPTTPDIVPESDPNVNEGQPAEEFSVDVDRFAHLLSNHFLFDHLEYAFYLLSKRVSVQFRDSINVDVRLLSSPESEPFNPSVDINILKGQLEGAVGSFIEDKLPAVWSQHAAGLDKNVLQTYIIRVVEQLCPSETTTVSNVCLEDHAQQFLSSVDRYVGNHMKQSMADIESLELPSLFETARAQVHDILAHFNDHVLGVSRLELVLSTNTTTSTSSQAARTIDWIESPDEILGIVSHLMALNQEDRPQTMMVQAVRKFANMARVIDQAGDQEAA